MRQLQPKHFRTNRLLMELLALKASASSDVEMPVASAHNLHAAIGWKVCSCFKRPQRFTRKRWSLVLFIFRMQLAAIRSAPASTIRGARPQRSSRGTTPTASHHRR